MNDNFLQKVGAVASFAIALLFIGISFVFFVLLPSFGINNPTDLANPAKAFPVLQRSPSFTYLSLVDIPFCLCLVFVVITVHNRLIVRETHLAQVGLYFGITSALILLVVGIVRFRGLLELTKLYSDQPHRASEVYVMLTYLLDGLDITAVVSLGLWYMFTMGSAIRFGTLPIALAVVGFLLGVMHFFCFLFPFPAVVDFFWYFWLGGVFWRKTSSKSTLNEVMD